ncbi:MAG: hypothetical protein JHC71_13035, partial [Blastococcus sp.]|nr:hypothetical protein [Blastococcus sp.]
IRPAVFLCEQVAKDALDQDGQPVDWRGDARTFLYQLGVRIPDNAAALVNDSTPPGPPEVGPNGV